MIDLEGNDVSEQQEEVVAKRKKVSLFDWLNELNQHKEYIFNDVTAHDFNPFMVNRGLSQNMETVLIANEMNKHWQLDKQMVHDFYYYIIPKKKRFSKWAKANNDDKDLLDLIVRHYTVNRVVAIDYLKLLTSEDIDKIKEMYDTGGKRR